MYEIIHMDSPAVTDGHWKDLYALLKELNRRYKSPFISDSWEATRDRILSRFRSHVKLWMFTVLEGGRMIGWVDLRIINPGTDVQKAYFDCDALMQEIPQSFVRAIAPGVRQGLLEAGCDYAHFFATNQRAVQVGRQLRGKRIGRVDRYRLYREKANRETMERWLIEIPERNPDVRMDFFENVPECHARRYVDLMNAFLAAMPSETQEGAEFNFTVEELRKQEIWRQENKMRLYICALLTGDKLIGYSCAHISESDPSHVYQMMTGVDTEYQGRGLAKWAKAALFDRVSRDFEAMQSFYTNMRAINEPIQALNRQMGYELESRGEEMKVMREDLRVLAAKSPDSQN